MRYEIYIDSLLFINFTMNLYLLIWVNRSTFHTATSGRIILGALIGAAGYLLTLCSVGPPWVRMVLGLGIGMIIMPVFTFSVRNMRMFLKLLTQLSLYSFMMGGVLLFLVRWLPGCRRYLGSVAGLAGIGGILFLVLGRYRIQEPGEENLCRATLRRNGTEVTVTALLDSGNSLVEPISGKPVCVVGREVQQTLWGEDTKGIRVIPYHSIGKQNGIMWGYPLEKLELSVQGMCVSLENVYIAVSDEAISPGKDVGEAEIKMILNPELLRKGRCRERRRNVRRNDFESSDAGKNAV